MGDARSQWHNGHRRESWQLIWQLVALFNTKKTCRDWVQKSRSYSAQQLSSPTAAVLLTTFVFFSIFSVQVLKHQAGQRLNWFKRSYLEWTQQKLWNKTFPEHMAPKWFWWPQEGKVYDIKELDPWLRRAIRRNCEMRCIVADLEVVERSPESLRMSQFDLTNSAIAMLDTWSTEDGTSQWRMKNYGTAHFRGHFFGKG